MYRKERYRENSTTTIRVVCAVLFCLFSFLWLYYFQADLIALRQHVLSHGQTRYHSLWGAVIITFLLLLLAKFVSKVARLRYRAHALSYLPSALLLVVLCDVDEASILLFSFGKWCWLAPVVLILWGAIVWCTHHFQPYDGSKKASGLFSRRMWVNTLVLSVEMIGVVAFSNTNAVLHYRLHAERALMQGNVEEALCVGALSLESDPNLFMLRAYALHLRDEMPDRLFQYPVVGKGKDLLPLSNANSQLLFYPVDSMFRKFGARPVHQMTFPAYLKSMRAYQGDSLFAWTLSDYQLCSLLVDRNLDVFAKQVTRYWALNDSLPLHYREALVLYTRKWRNPILSYKHPVLDEDFTNFLQMQKEYTLENERKLALQRHYAGTYWYYYFCEK